METQECTKSNARNFCEDDYDDFYLDSSPQSKEVQLMESLNAVTKHFAHVQFRLRQVIKAPLDQKELLLKDLEEFTFKGIPEAHSIIASSDQSKDNTIEDLKKQILELQESVKNLKNTSAPCARQTNTEAKPHVNSEVCSVAAHEKTTKKTADLHYGVKHQFHYMSVVRKLTSVLHMVNIHCKEEKDNIRRNLANQKHINNNHWGDIRAYLEVAISEVVDLALEPEPSADSDYMSDSEESVFYGNSQKLASVVRKKLAPAIQNLMQHGLMPESRIIVRNSLTFVIGCVPHSLSSSRSGGSNSHAWELILKFYKLKNGEQFNSSPALKLSQSYNLDVNNHCVISSTQKLLIAIGSIITSHSKYKRSNNSQFKAFICAGLNEKMLVNWLQLIYRYKPLIEMYYEPWSYAVRTGFEDTLKSLESLHHYHFSLPVDVAIHQLENIKDAF